MTLWLACATAPGPAGRAPAGRDTADLVPSGALTATDTGAAPAPVDTAGAPAATWADVVVSAPGADDAPFGDPSLGVNGARGSGALAGGTDVFSLDATGPGASIVVAWSGRRLVDGPGVDLVVFENPFDTAPGARFMDPCVVEVSADGVLFEAFPWSYEAADPAVWSADPADWVGFAGLTPVLLHEGDNRVDPFDAVLAGGDGFDLADLPADSAARAAGAAAVRVTSATAFVDPRTGAALPHDPVANGADLDAVYGRTLVWE